MDFLANENFPAVSIRLLRGAGHGVASVLEETPGNKDRSVLERAHEENRIVLTFDRDYGELIYRHRLFVPSGIIYFRFTPSTPEEPAEMLLNILDKGNVPILGRFTVVERGRIRQRVLFGKR
jgi:predicted nuclease of predicted toxin-antitoxin system